MVGVAHLRVLMSLLACDNTSDRWLDAQVCNGAGIAHPTKRGEKAMLYLGIDIGKQKHVAALLSADLLIAHGRYDACPVLAVENSRAGFERLLATIRSHGDPATCHVLMERTGHYGQALEQYLHEHGCHLYRMQARARYSNNKTDTQDARAIAVLLYSQEALHAPTVDERLRIAPLVAPSPLARTLRGLVRHRYELTSETTRRKNKLTAIMDELFPEFDQVYSDAFSDSALACREKYPTPELIAAADLDDLCATRKRHYPARADLARLQDLAASTIGTRDRDRHASMLIEQRQLIAELRLMNAHIDELDRETERLITGSREGVILTSFPGIGAVQAAKLLAGIGSIANFADARHLRSYLGWSPRSTQTGTSQDSSVLSKGGNPMLKQTLYLITMTAIRIDPHWKSKYTRMVARKCSYDGRKKQYVGKMKVIGHIAGQITGLLYRLLRKDHDLLQIAPPGGELPAPDLYTCEKAGGPH
jgi:transposase